MDVLQLLQHELSATTLLRIEAFFKNFVKLALLSFMCSDKTVEVIKHDPLLSFLQAGNDIIRNKSLAIGDDSIERMWHFRKIEQDMNMVGHDHVGYNPNLTSVQGVKPFVNRKPGV